MLTISNCSFMSGKWPCFCSLQGFYLSGCVYVIYFCECLIFIRDMLNIKLTAWLTICTKLLSTSIFLTGERCIKITIKLCYMTEHSLLIGIAGFTISGISCLTVKLSRTKERCQGKSAFWMNMFYKTLSTFLCVCLCFVLWLLKESVNNSLVIWQADHLFFVFFWLL